MSQSLWGVLAALAAALLMTVGFIFYEKAWKSSALGLNMFKGCLAGGLFVLVIVIQTFVFDVRSYWVSPDVFEVGMLLLASTVGTLLGDILWLQALQMMGARRVILMDSLRPFGASVGGKKKGGERESGGKATEKHPEEAVEEEEEEGETEETGKGDGGLTGAQGVRQSEPESPPLMEDFASSGGKMGGGPVTVLQEGNGKEREEEALDPKLEEGSEKSLPESAASSGSSTAMKEQAPHNPQRVSLPESSRDSSETERGGSGEGQRSGGGEEEEKNDSVGPCSSRVHAWKAQSEQPTDLRSRLSSSSCRALSSKVAQGYALNFVNILMDVGAVVVIKGFGKKMSTWDINAIRFGFAGYCLLFFMLLCTLFERLLSLRPSPVRPPVPPPRITSSDSPSLPTNASAVTLTVGRPRRKRSQPHSTRTPTEQQRENLTRHHGVSLPSSDRESTSECSPVPHMASDCDCVEGEDLEAALGVSAEGGEKNEVVKTQESEDVSRRRDSDPVLIMRSPGRNRNRVREREDKSGTTGETETEGRANRWHRLPCDGCMTRWEWVQICIGVFIGTFLSPALSQYALFQVSVGVSITLFSTGPLWSLPLVWLMKKERVSARGVLGAFVCVGGVCMMALG
uniref:EamA domain-containing protein n=1 Tax=Chromera velia CCMP2878 TaxID=1169474 RepID=A0A0G4G8Y3_9ALVE|eukprot:Cvel_20727.t1-p1 / transcript=Cvel_20727.t1 / gene=Cvel_20727 / organism=Chromera_velia_CCMP2878 / gene_product=hypothetical protein / transcript_product=hypothetical protein / location=Cvel_scaffold1887:5648-8628(-) / protein_length=626 / sequence_SO=supercontig / SO=protein_coding / is_pseudo=false